MFFMLDLCFLSLSPPHLPPPKGMTALLNQLPLMMDPCFAAKFLGDLKSSIKMEWEKAIESQK